MKGDRGFAGARSALHNEGAAEGSPDDLVLLPLDGRNDVPHSPGTRSFEGGEQSGRSGQSGTEHPVADFDVVAEQLVLEIQDPAPFGEEMAAQHQSHGVGPRRAIERLGDRGAPIDHQRLLVGV